MGTRAVIIAAIAWFGLVGAEAQARTIIVVTQPGKDNKSKDDEDKVIAELLDVLGSATDPEPPLHIEVGYNNANLLPPASSTRLARSAIQAGPRGTTLTLTTPGGHSGTAQVTFSTGAPPMRLSLRLQRVPSVDLTSLSLTSGTLTLQVGRVGTGETTVYFDAKGRRLTTGRLAAYTVQAKRSPDGGVRIDLRRGAGAALGRSFSVRWEADYTHEIIKLRLRG